MNILQTVDNIYSETLYSSDDVEMFILMNIPTHIVKGIKIDILLDQNFIIP